MTDHEPHGYRCECGEIRLEHLPGGKACLRTDCTCTRFRAAAIVRPVEAPTEPMQEDDPMTIHAVPRDEMDQSEAHEGALANGTTDTGDDGDEAVPGDEVENPGVLERIAAIRRNKADVLKEFASQEAALLDGVRAKLVVARLEVERLEDAEAGILEAMGADKPAKSASQPGVAKTSPAKKAAATRKASTSKDKGPSFKAQLIEWVTKHPKSRVEDIAEAFPDQKRPFISSTLYNAKGKGLLKSTGDRGSMKWSAA